MINFSRKKILYFKILGVIVLGFFIANILSKEIFLANSPRLRPDLRAHLTARIVSLLDGPKAFIARLFRGKTIEEELINVSYRSVAKGVYAKEKADKSIKLYREDDVEWLYYEFDYKGKHYRVRYAKSDGLPNQNSLERMVAK